MWSAAAAVTCATVGLSGAVAASAAPVKNTPATQAANPAGEKDKKVVVYPRLDSTNIVTDFTAVPVAGTTPAFVLPTGSTTYTGSARRGHVWVHDTTGWRDITSQFPAGYYYDISLAAGPSTAFTGTLPTTIVSPSATGAPAGLLRVTVRRADGAVYRTDCTVSDVTGTTGARRALGAVTCAAAVAL